jgi:hypothetical protein
MYLVGNNNTKRVEKQTAFSIVGGHFAIAMVLSILAPHLLKYNLVKSVI